MKHWIKKSSRLILKTPFFKVRKDLVELPNKKTIDWVYWDANDSALVIGMTPERKVVMLRQYRYLVQDRCWEFPAGVLHRGESPSAGAKREFEEESGYRCHSLLKLGAFYESYGQFTRKITLFFSSNVTPGKQLLDRGKKGHEDIEIAFIPYRQAVNMAIKNQMTATSCATAILLLNEKIRSSAIRL